MKTVKKQKIISIKPIGVKPTIDLEVDHKDHNFYAEGMVTSNSHSFAYSILTAQTVYLKFNYPTQFYLSLLKMTRNEPDPIGEISKIHKEMSSFGVELLPPSLTLSGMDFAIEDKNIRFGLASIKGISEKTMEKFNNFQRQYASKFELFSSAKKAGLGIGIISAIIQAGCLDSLGKNRVLLVYEAQLWNLLKDHEKLNVAKYAKNYEDNVAKTVKALVEVVKDEKGKPLIKPSRFETIKRNSQKYKEIYNKNKISLDFANYFYSEKLLGYNTGKKLRDIFLHKKSTLIPISEVKKLEEKNHCDFIGKIDEVKVTKSKAGTPYANFQISDESGSIKVMLFGLGENTKETKWRPNKLEDCKTMNNGIPPEGSVVIVSGSKTADDSLFADSVASQQNSIYDKLSDLKDIK